MRLVHAAPAGLLVLLLAACGGSTGGAATQPADVPTEPAEVVATDAAEPPPSTAAGVGTAGQGWATKPCDLLAQADVEKAAGAAGMAPTPIPMDATSGLCGYRSADYSAEIVLSVWGGDQAVGMFTTLKTLLDQNAGGIEKVDGIGADAIFSAADGTLVVSKNGTAVQVAVRIPDRDPAAIKAIALDLGRQVAGRL